MTTWMSRHANFGRSGTSGKVPYCCESQSLRNSFITLPRLITFGNCLDVVTKGENTFSQRPSSFIFAQIASCWILFEVLNSLL